MNFGSNMHRLGRLKEKQRDIAFRYKHHRDTALSKALHEDV